MDIFLPLPLGATSIWWCVYWCKGWGNNLSLT